MVTLMRGLGLDRGLIPMDRPANARLGGGVVFALLVLKIVCLLMAFMFLSLASQAQETAVWRGDYYAGERHNLPDFGPGTNGSSRWSSASLSYRFSDSVGIGLRKDGYLRGPGLEWYFPDGTIIRGMFINSPETGRKMPAVTVRIPIPFL
jgi:hypothetical protein